MNVMISHWIMILSHVNVRLLSIKYHSEWPDKWSYSHTVRNGPTESGNIFVVFLMRLWGLVSVMIRSSHLCEWHSVSVGPVWRWGTCPTCSTSPRASSRPHWGWRGRPAACWPRWGRGRACGGDPPLCWSGHPPSRGKHYQLISSQEDGKYLFLNKIKNNPKTNFSDFSRKKSIPIHLLPLCSFDSKVSRDPQSDGF